MLSSTTSQTRLTVD